MENLKYLFNSINKNKEIFNIIFNDKIIGNQKHFKKCYYNKYYNFNYIFDDDLFMTKSNNCILMKTTYPLFKNKLIVSNEIKKILPIISYLPINNDYYNYINYYDDNHISYIPKNKINIVINKELNLWSNRFRKNIKIGRFLSNSLFYNEKIIETLVNLYKSISNFDNNLIIELEGEDIVKAYNEKNYTKKHHGVLHNSCMRYNSKTDRINFYAKNKNSVKLLVLKDETGKIQVRSLLWKTNQGYYMDRIYYTYDYQKDLFLLYANYKNYKNFYNYKDLMIIENVNENNIYPYMDTFIYFSPKENILKNKYEENYYRLRDL